MKTVLNSKLSQSTQKIYHVHRDCHVSVLAKKQFQTFSNLLSQTCSNNYHNIRLKALLKTIQMQFRIKVGWRQPHSVLNYYSYVLPKRHPEKEKADMIAKMKFTQVKPRDATLKTNFSSRQLTQKMSSELWPPISLKYIKSRDCWMIKEKGKILQ